MPVHNADIAAAFEEIAELLELGDENPFRIRAYRNAARVVGGLSLDLAGSLAAGKELPKLPGIGADLAGKIHEIADTGTCKLLERLRKKFPAGITELMRLPGLGPKRVRALFDRRITSLEALERAARSGKLAEIPGFGEKTAQRLADAAAAHAKKKVRFKLAVAAQYAEPFARHLGATVAGSYRRMKETVGDLDFLVASDKPEAVVKRFAGYGEVKQVTAQGPTRASAVLACGLQCDLRVVPKESFGAALHYFTGSKAHNIAVRKLGIARGLKVVMELNAHPDRLDLADTHCRMAKDEGVLVAVNSDAHGVDGFELLRYGVGQARRGWLERKDVLNAKPLREVRAILRERR